MGWEVDVGGKLASYPLSEIGAEGGGEGRMAPADVLPPKKQAVVDRLRRRIESYRRHQSDCIPRFDHTFNGVVEQNLQDTLLLKQRFLESKAKSRGIKKSEKKPPENPINKFSTKRCASEEGEINGDNINDPPPNKSQQPSQKSNENLTKFSVEIVQQLEFTTTTTNSQISTNVTVKALNTSVKSDVPQSPKPPTPRNPDIVECKREPENVDFVDLEQCAAAVEKDAAGGSSFPGFSDFICDDTSDAIITSDAFNDLISEISDFNPEFMKDFDFDGGDTKPQITEERKPENMGKPQQSNIRSLSNCPNKLSFSPNVEFKAELSPAAQTLKQMAEQHQHKAQMSMNYNPSRPSPKPYDFQFNNTNDFTANSSVGTNQQNFKQNIASPPCSLSFNTDTIKQEVFSNQNSPLGYSPGRKIPSPQQVRLNSGYKPQFSFGSPGGNSNYPSNRPSPQQQCGGPQSAPQQPKSQQQPPRPPSSGATNQFTTTTVQVNQNQQLQSQGQVQVTMAQSMNGEMKGNSMSLGAQQAVFMTGNQTSFCTATQSQTINFTQQSLRQRAPMKPTHPGGLRPPHPQVMDVMSGHVGPQQMGPRPDYSKGMPSVLRFQPRMMPLQPMPPSGPMMRASQPYMAQSMGSIHPPRHHPYNQGKPRHNLNTHNPDSTPNWRPMLSQQQRPQFLQAQGVTFSTSETQMSAGQLQHSNMPLHQQSLGIHQVNPTMSLRVQMSQNMNTSGVFTSSNSRQQNLGHRHPTLTTSSYPTGNMSSSYSSSPYSDQSQQQSQPHHPQQPQQQQQQPSHQPQQQQQQQPHQQQQQQQHQQQQPHQQQQQPQPPSHQQQQQHQQQAQHQQSHVQSQQHSTFQQSSLPSDFNLDFLEQFPTGDGSNFAEQEFLNSLDSGASFSFQDIL